MLLLQALSNCLVDSTEQLLHNCFESLFISVHWYFFQNFIFFENSIDNVHELFKLELIQTVDLAERLKGEENSSCHCAQRFVH